MLLLLIFSLIEKAIVFFHDSDSWWVLIGRLPIHWMPTLSVLLLCRGLTQTLRVQVVDRVSELNPFDLQKRLRPSLLLQRRDLNQCIFGRRLLNLRGIRVKDSSFLFCIIAIDLSRDRSRLEIVDFGQRREVGAPRRHDLRVFFDSLNQGIQSWTCRVTGLNGHEFGHLLRAESLNGIFVRDWISWMLLFVGIAPNCEPFKSRSSSLAANRAYFRSIKCPIDFLSYFVQVYGCHRRRERIESILIRKWWNVHFFLLLYYNP